MKRTSARLLCMTVVLLGPTAASAAVESELQLSRDGVHWADSLNDPLFDTTMRWVPGDSEYATFFIRNRGGGDGDLTVDVVSSSVGNLIDSGDLHITAKGGGGAWTSVSTPGRHRLLTRPSVPNRQMLPIEVNVRFDRASVNATQLRASTLKFIVTLTESSAGEDSDTAMPDTGAPEVRWIFAIGALFIGIGLALVTRRNRAPREVQHV